MHKVQAKTFSIEGGPYLEKDRIHIHYHSLRGSGFQWGVHPIAALHVCLFTWIMNMFHKTFLAVCAVLALLTLGSVPACAQMSISIDIAPPPLPTYEQPVCPDDGYLWVPGYWAYGDYGYYWVPGTWVQPPEADVYWTPCYWGWDGGVYVFNEGYWGPNVGYYGGINYGCGYGGNGYYGGRWDGGHFSYNTSVSHVNSATVHNTYADKTAIRSNSTRVSYNGGQGGVQAQPTAQEQQFAGQRHIPPTSVQQTHAQAASQDRGQLATANGGKPITAAIAKPESYTTVAQKHAAAQPLTSKDSPKAKQGNSAQSSAVVPPNPQVPAEKKPPVTFQNPPPPENRDKVVAPSDKPAEINLQSRPEAEVKPQTPANTQVRPEAEVRPQAPANTQVRPEAEAKPQSPEKTQPAAAPQQSNKQESN